MGGITGSSLMAPVLARLRRSRGGRQRRPWQASGDAGGGGGEGTQRKVPAGPKRKAGCCKAVEKGGKLLGAKYENFDVIFIYLCSFVIEHNKRTYTLWHGSCCMFCNKSDDRLVVGCEAEGREVMEEMGVGRCRQETACQLQPAAPHRPPIPSPTPTPTEQPTEATLMASGPKCNLWKYTHVTTRPCQMKFSLRCFD